MSSTLTAILCARYRGQQVSHRDVLARAEEDLAVLAAVEIAAPARSPGVARLADLAPDAAPHAQRCATSHRHLADKVGRMDILGIVAILPAGSYSAECCKADLEAGTVLAKRSTPRTCIATCSASSISTST